jgi:hypothetical protein
MVQGYFNLFFLLLITNLQVKYYYFRMPNFLKCHCIMLQQSICGIAKLHAFFKNMGSLEEIMSLTTNFFGNLLCLCLMFLC